jgi:hypothetical protein
MSYRKREFGVSFIFSVLFVAGILYLIASSIIAMAFLPALGVGGLYAQADSIEGSVGTVYPEYQGDFTAFDHTDFDVPYNVDIGTTTPTCGGDGIPMLVVELDGQAVAENFEFRKDLRVPFLDDRWMVIEVKDPAITLSGSNLKIFVTQLAGDSIRIRNVRLLEGGIENPRQEGGDTWGPDSSQFALQGGLNTSPNVPGLEADSIQAWLHAAVGERITLETDEGQLVNAEVSYRTTQQVEDFYTGAAAGENAKLGFGLPDQNIDFDAEDRLQRGFVSGGSDQGYFTCDDQGEVAG